MKIPIADNLFLQYTKSAFIGGDCIGVSPMNFEWELAEPQDARFVTDSFVSRVDGRGKVAWLLEPFFLHPENYFAAMNGNFDVVLTHNQYFAQNKGWKWYPHGGSWIAEKDWGIKDKLGNISILLSNKKSMAGHRLRHEIVDKFSNRIDVFGLNKRVRPIEAYGPYCYSIIVENECVPGYFTEKLIDCLSVGTIPIYCGCPNIGDYFNTSGIIQFRTLGELSEIIRFLENKKCKYNVKTSNMEIAKRYRVCEDNLFMMYPELFREG